MEVIRMNNKVKTTHGIRKYKIGAASVVLGTIIFLTNQGSGEVKAAEVDVVNQDSIQQTTEVHSNLKNNHITTSATPEQNGQIAHKNAKVKTVENTPSTQSETEQIKQEAAQSITKVQTPEAKATTDAQSTITPRAQKPSIQVSQPQAQKAAQNVTQSKNTAEQTIKKQNDNSVQLIPEGQDISQKVKVQSAVIQGKHKIEIKPHKGEKLTLKYKWLFDKNIKPGDYFDFELSKNVNINGVSKERKIPHIFHHSEIVAIGKLINEHKVRYIFTNYVKNHKNVQATLDLNLYIDPKVVTHDGYQIITSKLGQNTTQRIVNVEYLKGISQKGVNIKGAFREINKSNNTFQHVAFVSNSSNQVKSGTLIGNVLSQKVYTGNPVVKIYQVIGSAPLNQSMFADTTNTKQFKDISHDMVNNIFYTNNGYRLDIEDLSQKYVVVYEGKYINDARLLKYETQLIGYPNAHSNYRLAHMGWTNALQLYKNNAAGYGIAISDIDNDDFIANDEQKKEILKGEESTPKINQWNDGNIKIIEPKKENPRVDSDDFILKEEDLNKILKDEPKVPKKGPWNDGNIKIIEPKKEHPKDKMESPKPQIEQNQEIKPKKEHSDENVPNVDMPKISEPQFEEKAPQKDNHSQNESPKVSLNENLKSEMHVFPNMHTNKHSQMLLQTKTHHENVMKKNQNSKHKEVKMLPEAGQDSFTQTTGFIGALLTVFGVAALIKRRNHSKH